MVLAGWASFVMPVEEAVDVDVDADADAMAQGRPLSRPSRSMVCLKEKVVGCRPSVQKRTAAFSLASLPSVVSTLSVPRPVPVLGLVSCTIPSYPPLFSKLVMLGE